MAIHHEFKEVSLHFYFFENLFGTNNKPKKVRFLTSLNSTRWSSPKTKMKNCKMVRKMEKKKSFKRQSVEEDGARVRDASFWRLLCASLFFPLFIRVPFSFFLYFHARKGAGESIKPEGHSLGRWDGRPSKREGPACLLYVDLADRMRFAYLHLNASGRRWSCPTISAMLNHLQPISIG